MTVESAAANLAICLSALLILWPSNAAPGSGRLRRSMRPNPRGSFGPGTISTLASLSSMLRCGMGIVESAELLATRPFATKVLSLERSYALLWRCRSESESPAQVQEIALALTAAYRLSEELGCEAARSVDAAAMAYRRSRNVDELRSKAFSMPKATVRLLSILPFVAIAVGELIGIPVLSFLFTKRLGMLCLVLGCCSYVLGVIWMRALLRHGFADGSVHGGESGGYAWETS